MRMTSDMMTNADDTYACGSCQETNCRDIENTCHFSDDEEN